MQETYKTNLNNINELVKLDNGTKLVDKNNNWYVKNANSITKSDKWHCETEYNLVWVGAHFEELGLRAVHVKEIAETSKKRGGKSQTLSVSQIIANAK